MASALGRRLKPGLAAGPGMHLSRCCWHMQHQAAPAAAAAAAALQQQRPCRCCGTRAEQQPLAATASTAAQPPPPPPPPPPQQQQQQQQQQRAKPLTNAADRQGSPFHQLGLREITDGMGRVRVRQHVNPLSSQFASLSAVIDWSSAYDDPSLPLFVDMGCGPGRFLLLLARSREAQPGAPAMNYLGLEIRQPLVERANKWASELGLSGRVHYAFTNVSASMERLLSSYPGAVTSLAAQFPDPLFKKRHRKRRMVQGSVVEAARSLLAPGGTVFLQSDVLHAATMMRDEFEAGAGDVLSLAPVHAQPGATFQWNAEQEAAAAAAEAAAQQAQGQGQLGQQQLQGSDEEEGAAGGACEGGSGGAGQDGGGSGGGGDRPGEPGFVSRWAVGGWLVANPLGVPTEREHYVAGQGGRVFRVLLVKDGGV